MLYLIHMKQYVLKLLLLLLLFYYTGTYISIKISKFYNNRNDGLNRKLKKIYLYIILIFLLKN